MELKDFSVLLCVLIKGEAVCSIIAKRVQLCHATMTGNIDTKLVLLSYLLSIRGCIQVHLMPGTLLTIVRPICINSGIWYCSLSSKLSFANHRVWSTESFIDFATLWILEIPWWRRKHAGSTQMSTWLWFFLLICSTSLKSKRSWFSNVQREL